MNESGTSARTSSGRGRGVGAWVVVVIASLLFPVALTAFWAQRTLVDTERYVATVAPLAQDPTVQKAVGAKVTDVLITQLDAGNRLQNVLPSQLAPLAPLVASGVNNLVTQQVEQFFASPKFAELWEGINRQAQKALISALSGEPTGSVSIQGDQIILDTGDLIAVIKQRLVDRGLTWAANIPVPPIADRQVVLMTSPQLAAARTYYAIGQPIAAWLLWVVLAMFLGAILLSTRRAKMVIAAGVGIILGAILLRLGMAFGENELQSTFAGTPLALAEQAFWAILTQYLALAVRTAFVLGVVLAAIGWFVSGTGSATAARGLVSGGTAAAGGALSSGPLAPFARSVARVRRPLQVVVVVIAGVVLVMQDTITGSTILWTLVIAVLALVALEVLAAAGRDAALDAAPEPADAVG